MHFKKKNIVLILVLILVGTSNQIIGEQSILITGSFQQVAVHGNANISEPIITDLLTGLVISRGISIIKNGNNSNIKLLGDLRIKIEIPKAMDIKIVPKAIVFEGEYIYGRDMHYIHIFDTDGEIEINADGYYVHLVRTSGSISVVTYEKIKAVLPHMQNNSLVSLDTYRGEISLSIPKVLQPRIRASARGMISIGDDDNTFNMTNPTGNKVILHSEQGKWINVRTTNHTPSPPTHPELREKLIKIFAEDQGKNRMTKISRIELTAMGYGPFIEAMDDTSDGLLNGPKNRKEIDKIISKYGIPTEEMVGSDYARSAIRMIIWKGDKEYIAKYRTQFKEAFGENWLLIKDKMKVQKQK